jgi:putative aldouronate transport system substrate-binding protein
MHSVKKAICMAIAMSTIACTTMTGFTTTAKTAKTAASTVTINFWVAGTAQTGQDRINKAVNKYLKSKGYNFQVNYKELGWSDTDYGTRAKNALAAGGKVDVCFTCNWVNSFQSNALQGNFISLDAYLNQYPQITKILGSDFINASKINGHIFALPCNKEKFHSWGYLLRTDLVKKYGINIKKIKSQSDLEPYFDKILKNETGITPLCIQGQDMPGWHFLDWDNISSDNVPGALYPSSNGSTKIVNQFLTTQAVSFYKKMKTYLAKGYISADATSLDSVSNGIKTGKYFACVSSLKPGKDAEMQASTGIKWTQVQITPNRKTNRETTGAMLAIAKQSKHPAEAMKFINLLYTDGTLLNYFIYGVKGTDYTVNSNKTISLKKNATYASGNGWRFGDQTLDLRLSYESANKYSSWKTLNKTSQKLQSYGFMFNTTKTSVQSLVANNQTVVNNGYQSLFYGQASDVDQAVSDWSAQFKNANCSKLLSVMQSQYNTWRKKNK